MSRAVVRAIRAWRWLWGCVREALGLLASLALVLFFLPLVPVFRMFEDIGEELRDD